MLIFRTVLSAGKDWLPSRPGMLSVPTHTHFACSWQRHAESQSWRRQAALGRKSLQFGCRDCCSSKWVQAAREHVMQSCSVHLLLHLPRSHALVMVHVHCSTSAGLAGRDVHELMV